MRFQHYKRLWAVTALALGLLAGCGGGGSGSTAVQPPPVIVPPPAILTFPLALQIAGGGIVQSQPVGVSCAISCSVDFSVGTVLTLTATPSAGQSFTGWSGDCAGAGSTCVVTLDQARNVTSTFAPSAGQTNYNLALNVTGSGSVSSLPAGISCPGTCSAGFAADTLVTLTATPAANQNFAGWTGACTGSASTCGVTMSQTRSVGAAFQAVVGTDFALSVTVSGAGRVASNPVGIDCGATCSANFAAGTAVTLTATPSAGQLFSSWSGACSGTLPTCSLQLTQLRTAQAVFAAAPVASAFQTPQLLEASNDFNVANHLLAVNRSGDAIELWEQSDGSPNGSTLKVFSRRYQAATGWQTPVVVPGATIFFGNDLVGGKLFLDDAGVATWIRPDMQTRRNTAATGWSAAFSPPNPRLTQGLTSAVMDASGNIGVLRSGSDVENNALAVGGGWGTWARVDTSGSSVAERAQVALSSSGTALAIWRESNPGDSNYSMKAARYIPATGWGTPESIETLFTNVTASDPALAIDAQGNGIAMWQQGSNNTVYYNIYRAGAGWQGAVEVTGQTNQLGSARIELVMTPDGRALAAWSGGSRFAALNTMQYTPATGWTAPVEVDIYNINRTLQMDNNGQAVMIYSPTILGTGNLNFDLVSRRLSFGGQWSAPTLVETATGDVVDTARFVMNPAGQGVVTWIQNDAPTTGARKSLWSAVLR